MESNDYFTFRTVNMTAKVVCPPLSAQYIASIPGVRYNPRRFPAGFIKLSSGSCNIFTSGRIIFLGLCSKEDLSNAIKELSGKLGTNRVPTDASPTISNIVCSFQLRNKRIDLRTLWETLKTCRCYCVFEADFGNGFHIHFTHGPSVILHHTGKGIVTGTKSEHRVAIALQEIVDNL